MTRRSTLRAMDRNGGVPSCDKSVIGNNAFLATWICSDRAACSVRRHREGTYFAYNADAIDGFTDTVLFSGSARLTPSLAQVTICRRVARLRARARRPTSSRASGSLVQLELRANGIDAVSAVLTADPSTTEVHGVLEHQLRTRTGLSRSRPSATSTSATSARDGGYPFVEVFSKEIERRNRHQRV